MHTHEHVAPVIWPVHFKKVKVGSKAEGMVGAAVEDWRGRYHRGRFGPKNEKGTCLFDFPLKKSLMLHFHSSLLSSAYHIKVGNMLRYHWK